jgi:hypothetical protein
VNPFEIPDREWSLCEITQALENQSHRPGKARLMAATILEQVAVEVVPLMLLVVLVVLPVIV